MTTADESEAVLDQPVTRRDVLALTTAIQDLSHSNTWRKSARNFLYIAVGVLIAYGGALGVVVWSNHQQAVCVQQWASATAARTNAISPLSAGQLAAIDKAFQSLALDDQNSRLKAFTEAQREELAAARAYRDAYGDNPPPPTPALTC